MLAYTYRFQFIGVEHLGGPRLPGARAYILAVWHQNLLAGILAQTGTAHTVIISRSRDGDPVAHVCRRLGHRVVRGSSRKGAVDKGGKEAKDEMIEVLGTGLPGAVTVDGPRGPAYQVKPGIIEMARRARVPIVPYLPLPQSYWSFNSWDRFRLPKPFSRIQVRYGAPLLINHEATFDDFPAYQLRLAQALTALEQD